MCNVLHQISEKVSGPVLQEGGNRVSDFRNLIAELKGMLQYEKEEFEVGGLRLSSFPLFNYSSPPHPPTRTI